MKSIPMRIQLNLPIATELFLVLNRTPAGGLDFQGDRRNGRFFAAVNLLLTRDAKSVFIPEHSCLSQLIPSEKHCAIHKSPRPYISNFWPYGSLRSAMDMAVSMNARRVT
jgi:hypothetical protein